MENNWIYAWHHGQADDAEPAESRLRSGASRYPSPATSKEPQPVKSAADVAAHSDVIITMLPDGPDVDAAVSARPAVLEGAKPGSLVVDMSSISPIVAQEVAAACEAKGVDFLDARLAARAKAIEGTLAIMVGANRRHLTGPAILQKMGSSVTLTGPVGAGNVTKLANQIMVACNIAAMSEALCPRYQSGLDPESSLTPSKAASPAAQS